MNEVCFYFYFVSFLASVCFVIFRRAPKIVTIIGNSWQIKVIEEKQTKYSYVYANVGLIQQEQKVYPPLSPCLRNFKILTNN